MGDISTEPSMEEILSSIKRIIAEEGDAPGAARARRAARAAPKVTEIAPPDDDDGILELSDPVPPEGQRIRPPVAEVEAEPEAPVAETPEPVRPKVQAIRPNAPVAAAPQPRPVAPARSVPDYEDDPAALEAIVSERVAQASRGSLEALSRMIVKPEVSGSDTLEGLVRDMLRPMLRDWLDANLPEIVEAMVAREIARIARRDD